MSCLKERKCALMSIVNESVTTKVFEAPVCLDLERFRNGLVLQFAHVCSYSVVDGHRFSKDSALWISLAVFCCHIHCFGTLPSQISASSGEFSAERHSNLLQGSADLNAMFV